MSYSPFAHRPIYSIMVDDIKNIDNPLHPLFKTHALKKAREVSKRPDENRGGRDTYSESDELLLSREAESLKKAKSSKDEEPAAKEPSGKESAAKESAAKEPTTAKEPTAKEPESAEEEVGEGKRKKHVDVII